MANSNLLQPGDSFEKYLVEQELGHGGMGAVYLVRHKIIDSFFALKVLFPEVAKRDQQFVDRFIREARLAGRIRHPNLIAVYDAGLNEDNGMYYLVMDYVSGGSVRGRIKREGHLSPAEAVSIVRQVAGALEAAQQYKMVHRDIKPDNIMFDGDGVVRLADLGIAKATDDQELSLTQDAAVFGTPAYMSPEQAKDSRHVDIRADIYSLGVVLFEMLCGHRPYTGTTTIEILTQVITPQAAPDISSLVPDIPKDVSRLVADMLEKDRDKRIKSPTELITRIDALGALTSCISSTDADEAEVTMPTMAAQHAQPQLAPEVTLPTMAAQNTQTQQAPEVTLPTMAAPNPQTQLAPEVTMPTMAAPNPQTQLAPEVTMPTMAAPNPQTQQAPEVTMPTMAAPNPQTQQAPEVTMPTMAAQNPQPQQAPEVTMPTMAAPNPQPQQAPEVSTSPKAPADSSPEEQTMAMPPSKTASNALKNNRLPLLIIAGAACFLIFASLVGGGLYYIFNRNKTSEPTTVTPPPNQAGPTTPTVTVTSEPTDVPITPSKTQTQPAPTVAVTPEPTDVPITPAKTQTQAAPTVTVTPEPTDMPITSGKTQTQAAPTVVVTPETPELPVTSVAQPPNPAPATPVPAVAASPAQPQTIQTQPAAPKDDIADGTLEAGCIVLFGHRDMKQFLPALREKYPKENIVFKQAERSSICVDQLVEINSYFPKQCLLAISSSYPELSANSFEMLVNYVGGELRSRGIRYAFVVEPVSGRSSKVRRNNSLILQVGRQYSLPCVNWEKGIAELGLSEQ